MAEVLEKKMQLTQIGIISRSSGYEIAELSLGFAKVILNLEKVLTFDDAKIVFEGDIYKAANFAALAAVNEDNVFVINSHVDFLSQVEVTSDEVVFEATSLSSSLGKRFVEVKGFIDEIEIFLGNFTILKLDNRSKIKI